MFLLYDFFVTFLFVPFCSVTSLSSSVSLINPFCPVATELYAKTLYKKGKLCARVRINQEAEVPGPELHTTKFRGREVMENPSLEILLGQAVVAISIAYKICC